MDSKQFTSLARRLTLSIWFIYLVYKIVLNFNMGIYNKYLFWKFWRVEECFLAFQMGEAIYLQD